MLLAARRVCPDGTAMTAMVEITKKEKDLGYGFFPVVRTLQVLCILSFQVVLLFQGMLVLQRTEFGKY